MDDFLKTTITGLRLMNAESVAVSTADILLVAFLCYKLLMLVRGTRAWRIMMGILIFLFLLGASDRLGLRTLHAVLYQATVLGPVALAILFLPELRQAIEGLGKLDRWTENIGTSERPRAEAQTVEEMVAAVAEMSAAKIGALIVLTKESPLNDIVANGVLLNARLSAPLLVSIFFEKNPLHDGAVIVRGDTIVAAACRLPLSESTRLSDNVHMRHRAGVGITESNDCFSIIVSEERGAISVASEGRLTTLGSHADLRELLNRLLRNEKPVEERPRRVRHKKAPAAEAKR